MYSLHAYKLSGCEEQQTDLSIFRITRDSWYGQNVFEMDRSRGKQKT